MADAILIRNLTELGIAHHVLGEHLTGIQVYTLIPEEYLRFIQCGLQPNIFSQHLTASESIEIQRQGFEDTNRLTDSFPLTESDPPINLARCFKSHYWVYLTEVYALEMALRRILDNLSGSQLLYLRRFYTPPATHAGIADPDAICAQMLDEISRENPSVRGIKSTTTLGGDGLKYAQATLRSFARSARHTAKTLLSRGTRLLSNTTSSEIPERCVIAFGSGYDALIVLPDALYIAAQKNLKPLWMTEWVDKDTLRSGLVYRDEYDQVERFSIDKYLASHPAPPFNAAAIREADRAYRELMDRLDQIEVIRHYRLNRRLHQLRHEFRRTLWRARVLDRVLARFARSDVVITDFNGLDERLIEQLAKRHKLTVHARPHGWIGNVEGFEFTADHYYYSGRLSAQVIDQFYGYGERIHINPDPSLFSASREWLSQSPEEQQAITRHKRQALSIDAEHVVLIMTTAARILALNEFDYDRWLNCWKTILDYLEEHPNVQVVVKSHKNNYDFSVAELATKRGITNLSILGGRLEDALILADLVVDLGKPGTGTLTALLFERPLLLYRGLYKYVRQLNEQVHQSGTDFLVDSPQALVQTWDRLWADKTASLANLKARNRNLLRLLAEIPDAQIETSEC